MTEITLSAHVYDTLKDGIYSFRYFNDICFVAIKKKQVCSIRWLNRHSFENKMVQALDKKLYRGELQDLEFSRSATSIVYLRGVGDAPVIFTYQNQH